MAFLSRLSQRCGPGLLAALAGAVLLTGCAGQNFSSDQLASLQPGRSTMADAVQALQAVPQQVLPQSDGSTVALWHFKVSVVTDAIYYRKEAILQFGPDGRLARVLDTTNVPLSGATRQKLLGAASIPQETPAPGEPSPGEPPQAVPSGATAIPLP
jgi:hypothetical protein